ncbi:major facilitator superfamily domain-containing protein [Dipodascopsis uninucleata]
MMSSLTIAESPEKDSHPTHVRGEPENVLFTIADDSSDLEVPDQTSLNKIYRKLDYRIIPALWCLYFLVSAVRSNVGLALTMNQSEHHTLIETLGLTSHDTSVGLALYYVAYTLFDVPFNLIMTRIAPHAWLSRNVITIGIVGSCMTAMAAPWSFILLRFLLGIVTAGLWPGMAYYLTLWYPPHRIAHRIGFYFTAAQISAAVVGLVSAGFQYMDGDRGLTGFQWMFLLYGVITIIVGISLLWWLPDRPNRKPSNGTKWLDRLLPSQMPILNEEESKLHKIDMKLTYNAHKWTLMDLWKILIDVRLYPLTIMYFGVVGIGIGIQNFATVIIESINPNLSSIDLSLLTAPIWLCDLAGILMVTPLSDKFHDHRALFFSGPCLVIITGLLTMTYATHEWPKYVGVLIVGLGLGPTVPICMTWTAEIFQPRHGEVGTAVATAFVSGLGNLGSVTTTYALYSGWPSDAARNYRDSNMVMVAMAGTSILFAFLNVVLRKFLGDPMTREERKKREIVQHELSMRQIDEGSEIED